LASAPRVTNRFYTARRKSLLDHLPQIAIAQIRIARTAPAP
jgi:hypothetical protein